MSECQVITERHLHGGRLASWIVAFGNPLLSNLFMRLILCEGHAREIRVAGFKIREEN